MSFTWQPLFHVALFLATISALEQLYSVAVRVSYSSEAPDSAWKGCRGTFNNDIKPNSTYGDQYTRYPFQGNDGSLACCYGAIDPFDTSDKRNEQATAAGCCFPIPKDIPPHAQLPCCSHGYRLTVNGKTFCASRPLRTRVKVINEVSTACNKTSPGFKHESQVIQTDKRDLSFTLIYPFCCKTQQQELSEVVVHTNCCAAGAKKMTYKHVAGYNVIGCL